MEKNKIAFKALLVFSITLIAFIIITFFIKHNGAGALKHWAVFAEAILNFTMNFTFLILVSTILGFNLTKTHFIVFFDICLIMVKFTIIKTIHAFIRENNLTFNFFFNNIHPEQVVTDQFTQVYILLIGFIFSILAFIYFQKTWKKFFTLFFIISFYTFAVVIHYFLMDIMHNRSLKDYEPQAWFVLNNYENHGKICKDLNYTCTYVKASNQDRWTILEEKDYIQKEMNNLISEQLKPFIQSNETEKYILLTKFKVNGVVAFSFGFKKVNEHVFVAVNHTNVHDLTMYGAIYFTIAFVLFLVIWSLGLYWVHKKHKSKKFFKPTPAT